MNINEFDTVSTRVSGRFCRRTSSDIKAQRYQFFFLQLLSTHLADQLDLDISLLLLDMPMEKKECSYILQLVCSKISIQCLIYMNIENIVHHSVAVAENQKEICNWGDNFLEEQGSYNGKLPIGHLSYIKGDFIQIALATVAERGWMGHQVPDLVANPVLPLE